ncbi:gamma-butyrobetaine dioxygenase [Condylostylus longicornis]|uniref:gamma-butyrobetaine dioxygenase n=1 Tax=Condylostylus longicornis TaxID=2530218 RepID=UPI00244E3E2C|nr:gamma-butyrobetaine dioxygenase [Condylostylus longicornis]
MLNIKNILFQIKVPCFIKQQNSQKSWFHLNSVLRVLNVSLQNRCVVVNESSSDKQLHFMKFPTVWLRDNCQCNECFHQSSKSRQIDWVKFDTKVNITNITASDNSISIDWSDKHSSTYSLDWLRERDFHTDKREKYLNEFYRPKTKHWSKNDFKKILSTFEYKNVMEKNNDLKLWLQQLAIYGVAIIKNAGTDKTAVRKLADRVGFIRKTTYGEEFIVEAKPGAKNYAYLSTPLPLHTDLPYYEYKPSVNLLHCVVQSNSKGGENLLADGFHVVDILKKNYPHFFETLTKTVIDWNDIGEDGGLPFHNIWRSPVICLDGDGFYTRINHSIPQRDSHFNVTIEEVELWYEAYSKFVKLLQQESVSFKLSPGDILTFNNIRLVHGRTGYDDNENNVRCIVGAYLDWDIIYSKLRVLMKNYNKNEK